MAAGPLHLGLVETRSLGCLIRVHEVPSGLVDHAEDGRHEFVSRVACSAVQHTPLHLSDAPIRPPPIATRGLLQAAACVSVSGGVVHAGAATAGQRNVLAVIFHPSVACGAQLAVAAVRATWALTSALTSAPTVELACEPVHSAAAAVTVCQVTWTETRAADFELRVTLDGSKVCPSRIAPK